MKKKIVAIILARGGSKGIKNKNIKIFNNKPLIYWTITDALNSKKIDSVWVSSDSNKILNVAKKLNVNTIKRPKKIAQDKSSSEAAWLHAIKKISKKYEEPYLIVGLQITSPIRSKIHIDEAIKQFINKKNDSLFSSSTIKDHFIWKYKNKKYYANYDIKNRKPRQALEQKYLENGSIYIFKAREFLKKKVRLFGKIGNYIMGKKYSFQIDDMEDFEIVKNLMKIK